MCLLLMFSHTLSSTEGITNYSGHLCTEVDFVHDGTSCYLLPGPDHLLTYLMAVPISSCVQAPRCHYRGSDKQRGVGGPLRVQDDARPTHPILLK
jgi:hypothetical protein